MASMLTPGVTNINTVRGVVRQRADIVSSGFITDNELNGYIASSYQELYDILAQTYEDYFTANTYQFTTDGVSEYFNLPDGTSKFLLPSGDVAPAFYKGLGAELWISSVQTTPQQWFTLHRFNRGERNRFSIPNGRAPNGYANLRYRLAGNQIWFKPLPQANQLIQLQYIPRAPFVVQGYQIKLSGVAAGDTLTINGSTTFTAVASGATGTQFNVGATDSLTAVNLASAIFGTSAMGLLFFACYASGPSVIVAPLDISAAFTFVASAHMNAVGYSSPLDGVSGWEEYVVVDAVIKCKSKEESDVSVEMQQKAELLRRISEAAAVRDPSEPQTVVDVTSSHGPYGFGVGLGDGEGGGW